MLLWANYFGHARWRWPGRDRRRDRSAAGRSTSFSDPALALLLRACPSKMHGPESHGPFPLGGSGLVQRWSPRHPAPRPAKLRFQLQSTTVSGSVMKPRVSYALYRTTVLHLTSLWRLIEASGATCLDWLLPWLQSLEARSYSHGVRTGKDKLNGQRTAC
jgi:hypothetical protein